MLPIESVPPTCYGGTERVVSYLTEELVKQGHQLTLFASGDSLTSAELVPCTKTALRLTPTVRDSIPYYMLMLDKVRERADEFDILHFHIDQFHFPIFRPMAQRTLTTLHGRQDLPDLQALYRGFTDMPLVSISNAPEATMCRGQLCSDGLSWDPKGASCSQRRSAWKLPRISWANLSGKARRSRDCHRASCWSYSQDRGQG